MRNAPKILPKNVTGRIYRCRLFSATYERFYSADVSIRIAKFEAHEARSANTYGQVGARRRARRKNGFRSPSLPSIFNCQRAFFPALVERADGTIGHPDHIRRRRKAMQAVVVWTFAYSETAHSLDSMIRYLGIHLAKRPSQRSGARPAFRNRKCAALGNTALH